MTSLRRQKRCLFRDVSEASQVSIASIYCKYPTKMVSFDLRRVIEISDKTDVGRLETFKK